MFLRTAIVALVAALVGAGPAEAAFPGKNGKIAFFNAVPPPRNLDIFSINPDGTDPTNLTNDPTQEDDPTWSPDGSKIAFAQEAADLMGPDIYSMNADGSDRTNLSNHRGFDGQPTWSPDGAKIAFLSGRSGPNNIYTMNVDGSNQTNLTNSRWARTSPSGRPTERRSRSCSGESALALPWASTRSRPTARTRP